MPINGKPISPVKRYMTERNSNLNHDKISQTFPIVAIGASAGGLQAMTTLLQHIPDNTGMAFVYIQNLSVSSVHNLAAIFQPLTRLKVREANDGMAVKPDHLFIIPSESDLVLASDLFTVLSLAEKSVRHSPIDHLFQSIAIQKRLIIGVILSGTATEGVLGLKAIKETGGLTFAQNETAEFQSMPKSAIAEGVVDQILSPAEIATEIVRLAGKKQILEKVITPVNVSAETDNKEPEEDVDQQIGIAEEDIKTILSEIKVTTNVDFSNYKPNTIHRRIVRRMVLRKQTNLQEYIEFMKKYPQEVNLLYQDLLINVTYFFRDPDAIDFLRKNLLLNIIQSKSANNPLRIWVPACSTGQEAYSLAMVIVELMTKEGLSIPIQIFGTDLSELAIEKARVGIYPVADLTNLQQETIDKYFTRVDGEFRIIKKIRDFCIFAPHNVLKDPPFSRVDIVSCCNLLIYLDTSLQRKALSNFHYALNNPGALILGKSETIASAPSLFSPVDKKVKIFLKKNDVTSRGIFDIRFQRPQRPESMTVPVKPTGSPTEKELPPRLNLSKVVDNVLLEKFVPAGVVVDHNLDIILFRGSTGLFLDPTPGRATLNLLKMVRRGLELELRNAANKAIQSEESVSVTGLDVTYKDQVYNVGFEIIPLVHQTREKLLLIVFSEVKTPSGVDNKGNQSKDRRVKQLEAELTALRSDLRSIIEEQEAANEELQSANEEIVSSNEELQSINEELETSKEELESNNEELMTINHELQIRNDQLAEAQEYTHHIINIIRESVIILDSKLFVKSANKAFCRTFKINEENIEGKYFFEINNCQWNIPKIKELLEGRLAMKDEINGFELIHDFEEIGRKSLIFNLKKISQQANYQKLILIAIEDITEHQNQNTVDKQ